MKLSKPFAPIRLLRRAGAKKEGDTIETIQGEPFGDPITLAARLQPWFGKEIELQVKRT